MTKETQFYTVKEIAALLRVHPVSVGDWLRAGQLRGVGFGGKTGWRIRAEDLELFLQSKTNTTQVDRTAA